MDGFDVETLYRMGQVKIIEKENGFVNKIEITTPDGWVALNRLKAPSEFTDKLLKASVSEDKTKMIDVINSNIGYLIEDKELSEKIQTNQADPLTKQMVIVGTIALFNQMGNLDL